MHYDFCKSSAPLCTTYLLIHSLALKLNYMCKMWYLNSYVIKYLNKSVIELCVSVGSPNGSHVPLHCVEKQSVSCR
jgi:hypothetical protein